MSTVVVKRLQRRPGPAMPEGEVILPPPPIIPTATGRSWGQMVMLLPMLGGSAAMALMYTGSGRSGPLAWAIGGLFGLSAIGMLGAGVMNAGGQAKGQLAAERREYLRTLSQLRVRVRRSIDQQRVALAHQHPEPGRLWSLVDSYRLWERRRTDLDFCIARVGIGQADIASPLIPPDTPPTADLEPLCAQALRRFVTTYAVIDDLPIAMSVNGFGRVYVQDLGDVDRRRAPAQSEPAAAAAALARALIAQLATFQAPDDVRIAVCAAPERRGRWDWLKWLPHAIHPTKVDALGPVRLVSSTIVALEAILDDVLASRPRFNPATAVPVTGPHLVVIIDGGDTAGSDHLMTEGGVEGVTLFDLSTPPPRLLDRSSLILHLDEGRLTSSSVDLQTEVGIADSLGLIEAEALARALSPLRLSSVSRTGEAPMSGLLGLADLLGISDPLELDPVTTWLPRPNRDRLRVPIGVGPDGQPVELDLKESAQDGMGPHGLLIGATGSGKSELLRTLVLALAVTHSSETLNFVLVDFKGGATFTKMDRLPHTSAVITNLADELPLVDRMTDSINGELVRRQELLRKAGNFVSQRDYEKARVAGAPLDPLPSLLVICDEFSELLSAKPDFIEMFVQIGRVGRSLGIHLLLASQRLEEGRLRGLDTHLSYRIGLRTFSAMESRVVLGVNSAYELPRAPGHGYLKTGTEELLRFRAAYVSGAYRPGVGSAARSAGGDTMELRDYSTQYIAPPVKEEKPEEITEPDDEVGESLLDILVGRLQDHGTPAHQVWLPPLDEPPTLDQMLPSLIADAQRGLQVGAAELRNAFIVPVGMVDKPFEQRRDLLWLNLAGSSGNMVIVGGPQSGKSTVLRTLIASVALTHTPTEVQFYCLDFGGGALGSMRELPHVGGVASRLDSGTVRRTVAEVHTLLLERERLFAEHDIDGMPTYRRLRQAGRFEDVPFGDVFLVVDGWQTLRNEFEELEQTVTDLANRGLSFGVHVICTAGRWMDLRPAVRDVFGTRLELRLGDPADSYIDRRTAVNVPDRCPGRGLTQQKLHFLGGLPRIDGHRGIDDLSDGVTQFIKEVRAAWHGPDAPVVRLLPSVVGYDAVVAAAGDRPGLPIGIAEQDLRPVWLNLGVDPHFLLFGDSECGKSGFLRALARSITDRYTPAQARVIVVDYRRSLLGAVNPDHLLGYGTSTSVTEDMMAEVVQAMEGRLPGPDVTAEQLRDRSWWRGPELYLLVDDYDLVASSSANPLSVLVPYLPQGRDVGLHVVVARRSGGAGRAMYEPFLMRIRELASPGLLMSGDKDEGQLLGSVKPQPLPPGRGMLVTRREGTRLIQLGWLPPDG